MRNRLVRLCVVVALVASAAGAAVIIRSELAVDAPPQPERIDRRVDRLHRLIIDVMRAEAAYVAPGQDSTPALVRFPEMLNEISMLTGQLSALRQSPAAVREIGTLVESTATLAQADAEAREHLLLGDVNSASHVIFSKAGAATQEMTAALGRLRDLERAEVPANRPLISERTWIIVGTVAALWVVSLLVFAVVPSKARRASSSQQAEPGDAASEAPAAATSAASSAPSASSIDLAAAADLCTAIARVESTGALNGLLSQAVTLLDAEGIVVWLESGGRLFASAAAGYPPDMLARLTPIGRDDAHAVATAWREATTETVDPTPETDGAVAVPLFNAAICFGVFVVALKPGGEVDAGTCAVARLFAAQLAVVVGGSSGSSSTALATGT